MNHSRLVLGIFLIALIVGMASSGLGRTVALAAMLENWLLDLRLALTAEKVSPDNRIAIVSITEDTLATLTYRHPVDRELLAGILKKADAAGARAIGFDILFDQATDPSKDRAFEDAARDASIPAFIGYANAGDGLTERQSNYLDTFTPEAQRAYVNLVRDDRDGTVRSTLSGREKFGEMRPGLANALAGLDVPEQRTVIRLRRDTISSSNANALYEPIGANQSDDQRAGDRNGRAVPGLAPKPITYECERACDDRKLAKLHTDIEADQCWSQLICRKSKLLKDAGKPKSMQ